MDSTVCTYPSVNLSAKFRYWCCWTGCVITYNLYKKKEIQGIQIMFFHSFRFIIILELLQYFWRYAIENWIIHTSSQTMDFRFPSLLFVCVTFVCSKHRHILVQLRACKGDELSYSSRSIWECLMAVINLRNKFDI